MASFTELVKAGLWAAVAKVVARETINAAVAATGSTQADAAQLKEGYTRVTGADATKGVLLPPAEAGQVVRIKNATAAILKVWPYSGDAINALAANASFSLAASVSVTLVSEDGTTWSSFPLLPS